LAIERRPAAGDAALPAAAGSVHIGDREDRMNLDRKVSAPASALVGGISSAARVLPDDNGVRFRVTRAQGPYIWDQDGRRYVDFALGYGGTILGHAHPAVVAAAQAAIANGSLPAFAHEGEEIAACALTRLTGALTQAVFVNSGSEAVHLACKIARAATGRSRIAKIAGSYDGWIADVAFGMVGAPESRMDGPRPDNGRTVLLRYNDAEDAERLFRERDDIAAILFEPVLCNAGCILPAPGYLQALQDTARRHGALLIADEVLAGFRLAAGLSSHHYGLDPDLATLGKTIGSGIPAAAVVGKPEVMALLTSGKVARAGTYSGNPLMAAAVAESARLIGEIDYAALNARGNALRRDIEASFRAAGMTLSTSGYGSVFGYWFAERPPRDYAEGVRLLRPHIWSEVHMALRRQGVMTKPGAWGRSLLSTAHDDEALATARAAFAEAARQVRGLGA
jgi:glutamate-1-semialdehyde 2,1-aminomutase